MDKQIAFDDPTYTIDPYTCTKEELKEEIERQIGIKNLKSGEEQGTKLFLNSTYGATGAKSFEFYNTALSESISLQSRQMTRNASNLIERFFDEVFKTNTELHKRMGISTELAQSLDWRSHKNVKLTQQGKPTLETMSDTDSVCGKSLISYRISDEVEQVDNIETLWKICIERGGKPKCNKNGQEFIDLSFLNMKTPTTSDDLQNSMKRVNYIYRHYTNKQMYTIYGNNGSKVRVTGDHSMKVFRGGKIIDILPREILPSDKLVIRKPK